MPSRFKQHSRAVGHEANCHCGPCQDARNFNKKLNRSGYHYRVPGGPVTAHLRELYAVTGNSLKTVAEVTGLPYATVNRLIYHSAAHVNPDIAARITSIDPTTLQVARPSRAQFMWRLNVLGAQGFSRTWLSKRLGFQTFSNEHKNVTRERWDALEKLWHEIGDRCANPAVDGITSTNIARTMTAAKNQGFHPRAAYDNEFDAKPADTREVAALIRADRDRLDAIVETRMNGGVASHDIVEELKSLYPDFKIDVAIERVRTRQRRETERTVNAA